VLELPPLEAGRSHELTLCTQPALRSAGCSSGDASVRVLGKHRLLVHGRRAAGVRFGLGAVAFPRPGTRLVRQPGGDGGMELWQVQQRSASLAAALPVLVAWYPWGRDPSARADLDLSLSLGLDVLAPTRRFIPLGVNLDFAGVGVSAGVTLERSRPASVRAGRLLLAAAGEPPELESSYGTHASARWGATLALSADWDTLHGAWQRLFLPELPVLGRGEP
jgi:hypothetical protein